MSCFYRKSNLHTQKLGKDTKRIYAIKFVQLSLRKLVGAIFIFFLKNACTWFTYLRLNLLFTKQNTVKVDLHLGKYF